MNINQRIAAELAELASQAQLRDLQVPRGIDLGSNDYLGLATDERLRQAVLDAAAAAPRLAACGSRLLSGHDEVWTALEEEFARWIGSESALFFTSGYAANIGLLGAVARAEDTVFSDSANHASLIDGIRLTKARRVVFPHLDLNALETELRRHGSRQGPGVGGGVGAKFIVVESIFSMDGDSAPLGELAALAARYGAELIVDEAHATGVRGPDGRGAVAQAGLTGRVFATVHTCGKALAANGAFVCGSQALRRLLMNRARAFIFNTALPPYFAAQVAAGMRLAAAADAEREHLARLGEFVRTGMQARGFDTARSDSHIVPVILGSNEAAIAFAARLQERGYAVRAIRPPTVPAGSARLRVSLTARLSQDVLADFIAGTADVRDHVSVTSR